MPVWLPSEEPLREGGDERYLNQETDDSFACCQPRQRVTEGDSRGEEATTMKRAYAEDEGFIPGEMRCGELSIEQVGTRKGEDDQHIGSDATQWTVTVP